MHPHTAFRCAETKLDESFLKCYTEWLVEIGKFPIERRDVFERMCEWAEFVMNGTKVNPFTEARLNDRRTREIMEASEDKPWRRQGVTLRPYLMIPPWHPNLFHDEFIPSQW